MKRASLWLIELQSRCNCKELERDFAEALGVDRRVVCSTGTSSVHLSYHCACSRPRPRSDRAAPHGQWGSILPILLKNAFPVFANVHPFTLVLDPIEVESGSLRTREL
jgi:perosamine synthetase